MSLLFTATASVIATCGLFYAGHKSWHAFHRAVGITPGTLTYTPPPEASAVILSELTQLQLDESWLDDLPPAILSQLARIDHKFDIYQQWQAELTAHGHVVATTQAQFTVRKLIYDRLPMLLSKHHRLVQHQQRLLTVNQNEQSAIEALNESLALLSALLTKIEQHLDELLTECRKTHQQELQVMQRYLDKL